MHFSTTLIALMATTVFALPSQNRGGDESNKNAGAVTTPRAPTTTSGSSWSNVSNDNNEDNKNEQKSPVHTTASTAGSSWSNVNGEDNKNEQKPPVHTTTATAPAPQGQQDKQPKSPVPTTTQDSWSNVAKTNIKISAEGDNNDNKKATTPPSPSPNKVFAPAATSLPPKLGSNPSETCTWEFILTCMDQANTAGDTCLGPLAKESTNCFSESTCSAKIGDNASACATCYSSFGKQTFVSACYQAKTDSSVQPVFEKLVSAGVCDGQGKVAKA